MMEESDAGVNFGVRPSPKGLQTTPRAVTIEAGLYGKTQMNAAAQRILYCPCGGWIFLLVLTLVSASGAADSSTNDSVGSEVPSFYVRAVTGPLAGKSVCYVCRNGERPVVLVLLRDLGPDVADLLKDLDRTVNQHRADGLRCFGVLLTDSPQKDIGRLQTLAFDNKIDLPLTLAGDAATQGSPLAFDNDSKVSIVTYRDRKIVKTLTLKPGACDEAARRSIVASAEKLVAAE